jgi:exonuclease V gamma subunit
LGDGRKAGDAVVVKYPLHPFSARYRSKNQEDLALKTWNRTWFTRSKRGGEKRSIFKWKNTEREEEKGSIIDGNGILKVLSDPVKAFLDACRIETSSYEEIIDDEEPFSLNNLGEWKLREAICRETFFGESDAIEKLRADGLIPLDPAGGLAIAREREQFQSRIDKVRSIDPEPNFGTCQVRKEIDHVHYRMDIDLLSVKNDRIDGKDSTAVLLDYGKLNGKRKLKLWLAHLFLNIERKVRTTLIALDGTIQLSPMESEEACRVIDSLSFLVKRNTCEILPFIPDVSLPLAEKVSDIDNARKESWKMLEGLFGRVYGQEYKLNTWVRDAFEDAETWEAAMEKIPGGESALIAAAREIYMPMLKCVKEAI